MTETPAKDSSLSDFRAIYRAHHGFVWHALHRFGTSPTALEDAVQDVFVVAYRRRGTFAGESTKAWLYGIARRVASNYRRGDRRRAEREKAYRLSQPRAATEGIREAIQTLDGYLASLAESDRELFILSELEGMTGPEIAQTRGRNVRTIYTRIRKLRMEFRADLLDEARQQRPRASARSWAVLVPALESATLLPASGWVAALGSAWVAVALGAAGAAGVLVVAAQAMPHEPAVVSAGDSNPHVIVSPESNREPKVALLRPLVAATTAPPPPQAPTILPPAPRAPPTREPRTAAKPPDASLTSSSLGQENALLARAKAALRDGNPSRALELTDEHAETFEHSVLLDLRMAVRIEALCGLKKQTKARGEATAFLREHPRSPFSARIKKSCAAPQENRLTPDTAGI